MKSLDMSLQNDKILVLGSTGLLGSTLVPYLEWCGYRLERHGRSVTTKHNADMSDEVASFKMLNLIKPDVIINLIGLTDVDACEVNPNFAYLGNVRVIENITSWIKKNKSKCHLIQISTDQVYDGQGPHQEKPVTLTNYYAFSKYAGELVATSVQSTILRTNFFGLSHCVKRQSLTDWLYRALSNNDHIHVFDDVLFNPLSMKTLSEMINVVLQSRIVGTYNLGSRGGMSKADFAYSFANALGLQAQNVDRTTTGQVTFLKTYRPKDMRMDCTKFESTFCLTLPSLLDQIYLIARDYYENA